MVLSPQHTSAAQHRMAQITLYSNDAHHTLVQHLSTLQHPNTTQHNTTARHTEHFIALYTIFPTVHEVARWTTLLCTQTHTQKTTTTTHSQTHTSTNAHVFHHPAFTLLLSSKWKRCTERPASPSLYSSIHNRHQGRRRVVLLHTYQQLNKIFLLRETRSHLSSFSSLVQRQGKQEVIAMKKCTKEAKFHDQFIPQSCR